MSKKIIRVSDAIPEMPLSFDRTVEQTLNKVCTARDEQPARGKANAPADRWLPQSGNARTGKTKQRLSRILAVSCAAVLLLGVFAVGGIVVKNALSGRSTPVPLASAAPEATKEATVPMNVGDHAVTIRLLPELPEAEAYAEARARALQPAFSEEDWGWIRRMDVSVHGFTIDGQTMHWVTVFRMAPGEKPAQYEQNPFSLIDLTGLELFEDGTVVTWNGVERKCSVNMEATPGTDSSDGAWIVSVYTQMERPDTDFAGTATVRQQFRLIDNKVDSQAAIATLGMIEQTFTFDASGAPAYAPQTPAPDQGQTLLPTPFASAAPEEANPTHAPMICYVGEVYGLRDEERPDAPDDDATFETVSSVVPISEIPDTDGQANFGEVGAAFYVTYDGLVAFYNGEWRLFVPEETGDDPDKVLWNDTEAFPGTFRFWDYDEQIGFREAPEKGVLFVCDFDGDGTKEEIVYEKHGQYLTISAGKASIDVNFYAGLEQAILLDLDPDSPRLNLLVVYNTGSEDYETAELHMENGRFVLGPIIHAYAAFDGGTVLGSATQTDILGTKFGARTYHGEDLTPDSEWFVCDVIPDEIQSASDRTRLIENGMLLHLVRDLPCTIDGADAVIPAGTYVYMTRWHASGTLAEIRTEDGTTALITVQSADTLDPEQYGYLIGGEMQETYFDNILFAD